MPSRVATARFSGTSARSRRPGRPAGPDRLARRNRPRSSARASAEAYGAAGSFRRHFRQIVSRSRGQPAGAAGATGSPVRTWSSVSSGVAPRNGGRPVSTRKDGPEGVDVGGRADPSRPAGGLLRGHVPGVPRTAPVAVRSLVGPLGQAEVGDFGRPSAGEQDVRRLEVAVDDAGAVGGVDGPGQRLDQPGGLGRGGSGPPPAVGQRAAGDELQREERATVVLADLVDCTTFGCRSRAAASASARNRARRSASAARRPGSS